MHGEWKITIRGTGNYGGNSAGHADTVLRSVVNDLLNAGHELDHASLETPTDKYVYSVERHSSQASPSYAPKRTPANELETLPVDGATAPVDASTTPTAPAVSPVLGPVPAVAPATAPIAPSPTPLAPVAPSPVVPAAVAVAPQPVVVAPALGGG